MTQLIIRLLLVHQLLVQVLQLVVGAFGFLSGIVNLVRQFRLPFIFLIQDRVEVLNSLLMVVNITIHALNPVLIVLNITVTRVTHVQSPGDLLAVLVVPLLLFLELRV